MPPRAACQSRYLSASPRLSVSPTTWYRVQHRYRADLRARAFRPSLFLAHSRDHVSFWNLVYDDRSWQQTREQAYHRLELPADGQVFLARLGADLDRAARAAQRGLPSNPSGLRPLGMA